MSLTSRSSAPPPIDTARLWSFRQLSSEFVADLKDVMVRYNKRTSAQHKRLVLLLIAIGALLRGYMLTLPITAEEAMAYMRYSHGSVGHILSAYDRPENQVLYSLLAKLSTSVFGVHLVTMRLPAYLAGVLSLPLFYFFVRSMFNRYIALIALALLASSGALIEQSALGRGGAVAWFLMVAALVIGRHMAITNNRVSGIVLGLVLALGSWSNTAMFPVVAMIYLWLYFYLGTRYKGTLARRLVTLAFSLAMCVLFTLLLYSPIVVQHGIGQLFIHPTTPRLDWSTFNALYPERAYDLWEWLVDTSAEWFAYAGIIAVVHAAYVSGKYRMFMLALFFSAVPLVFIKGRVAGPMDWLYVLYFLHLGMAIGTYYMLKFVHDKILPAWGKRSRTSIAAFALCVGTAIPGMLTIMERLPRLPEARACGNFLHLSVLPDDRVFVMQPWAYPVRFHALEAGLRSDAFEAGPNTGGTGYVVVSAMPIQTVQGVLEANGASLYAYDTWEMMRDWERMEIFAARLRDDATAGDAR